MAFWTRLAALARTPAGKVVKGVGENMVQDEAKARMNGKEGIITKLLTNPEPPPIRRNLFNPKLQNTMREEAVATKIAAGHDAMAASVALDRKFDKSIAQPQDSVNISPQVLAEQRQSTVNLAKIVETLDSAQSNVQRSQSKSNDIGRE